MTAGADRPLRPRAVGWALAGIVAGLLGIALGRAPAWSGSAGGIAALAGLAGVLLAEAAVLVAAQRHAGPGRAARPSTDRPADGRIDCRAMAAAATGPPIGATPWKPFLRLEPIAAGAGRRGRRGDAPRWREVPLLGRVALVSVFVGRDGRGWTDEEIRAAHASLAAAGRWIEREATRWGAPVNVGIADTFFRVDDPHDAPIELAYVAEGDGVGPLEADAAVKSMVAASRAAALLGFADVADMVAQVNRRVAADAHAWLFHLRRRGRSHAVPVADRLIRGVGLAVCYARESSFPEPLVGPGRVDPTTVAHELLHLFGAADKYGIPLAQFPPRSVSRRDIMRLAEDRLSRLEVGPLTAAELGWRDN